jgi:dTDP-glucose 4,6-dehydratase
MNPLASDLDHVLDHTRELWDELRGERLFITGGTGFFGCWLLESFLWANERLHLGSSITVLTRQPQAFIDRLPHLALAEAVNLLPGDVRSFAFPSGTFSHVIHAATQPENITLGFDPIKQFHANITGTQRTLEFAHTCATKKVLFTSSGAIYGNQPAELTHIPETYNGAPATTDTGSVYGHSKRISEYMCAFYAQKCSINVNIARCFTFVGPYLPLDTNYAIGNFIRDALIGSSIQINGDGTPYRSYLYTADLAIWLWTILFRGQSCRPYNVGSDEYLNIADLAQLVKKVVAPKVSVDMDGVPMTGKPAKRYVPSIERCKVELGLQVHIPLPDAIRRTAGWNDMLAHKIQKGA